MRIMKNFTKVAIVVIILGIGVFTHIIFNEIQTVAASPSDAGAYELKVGQPFPNLVLPSLSNGSPLSLAAFRGQKVILHIWASW